MCWATPWSVWVIKRSLVARAEFVQPVTRGHGWSGERIPPQRLDAFVGEILCFVSHKDMHELRLKVAGIAIALRSSHKYMVDDLRLSFVTSLPAESRIVFHQGEFADSPGAMEKLVDRQDLGWTLNRLRGQHVVLYQPSEPDLANQETPIAVIWDSQSRVLEVYGDGLGQWLPDSLVYHLFKLPVAGILLAQQGLLLHGCGVVVRGQGLIFSGPSGAGKSTMASLWHNAKRGLVVHDDCCGIRPVEGGYSMHGVPWLTVEGFCSGQGAPLKALFFLEHGAENLCTPITPVQALNHILPQVFVPFGDGPEVLAMSENCIRLIERIPAYRLAFAPTSDVVHLVDSLLQDI